MLRFRSASTSVADTEKAAARALDDALGGEPGDDVCLIVFHVSVGHDLPTVTRVLRERCRSARLVGCTAGGTIGREGANEASRAFALMAIEGDPREIVVAHVDSIRADDARARGRELALAAAASRRDVNMLMLLTSGLDVDVDEAIAGIESVFGADTTIFGGTSGDNNMALRTHQIVDERVFEHAAILVGFADPTLRIDAQASHGFLPAGIELEVTRGSGHRVHELDGEPAWRVYTRTLGLPETARTIDTAGPGALGVALPEDLAREYGDSHILRAVLRHHPDGTIELPTSCPAGARLAVMLRDEPRIFGNLDAMMEQLVRRIGGRRPVAVFHTDCAARGRLTVSRVAKEEIVAHMQRPIFPEVIGPWLGMYGFGEITPLGGRNRFHNYTTSLYVISRA